MDMRRVVPAARERRWRAVEDDLSADEHEPLDEPLHGAELVRDVDDGGAELPMELGEERRERFLGVDVDAGRRLVEDEQLRLPAKAFAMKARCC